MRQIFRAALCLLLMAVIGGSVGCHSHQNTDRRAVILSESDTNMTDFEELSNNKGYFLSECYLISDSQLLLVYYNTDYVYQFKIYDLKQKKITSISKDIRLENRYGHFLHLLNEYFYFFHAGQCYVYDFSCQLVKTIPMAEDILTTIDVQCWLSNDLRKMAYVKNNGTAYCLYWSDLDGANEESLQPVSVDLSPEEIIFSQDNRTIGFWGCAIPKGRSDSVDCYGYIIPANGTVQLYYQDNSYAKYRGDTLLVLNDSPIHPAAQREGKVRMLDLSDKKNSVITTHFADECEWAVLGSDTRYMVGVHLDEAALELHFSIYRSRKIEKEMIYQCRSEENFTDLAGCSVSFNVDTSQLVLFYFDTALGKNVLLALATA